MARDIQNRRFANGGTLDIICNADMRVGEIQQFCKLQDEFVGKGLSSHPEGRTRTIMDLAEALQYHPKLMVG